MNDKTRLHLIKIGFLLNFVFTLVFCLTFYVGFFSGGEVLITLNSYGEMYIEAFVYIPIAMFLIVFSMVLLSKLEVK